MRLVGQPHGCPPRALDWSPGTPARSGCSVNSPASWTVRSPSRTRTERCTAMERSMPAGSSRAARYRTSGSFPARRADHLSGEEYGTTVRFFDRARGDWRSIWISPVNHVVREFRVHTDGDETSSRREPRAACHSGGSSPPSRQAPSTGATSYRPTTAAAAPARGCQRAASRRASFDAMTTCASPSVNSLVHRDRFEVDWEALCAHTRAARSDLVLSPERPSRRGSPAHERSTRRSGDARRRAPSLGSEAEGSRAPFVVSAHAPSSAIRTV